MEKCSVTAEWTGSYPTLCFGQWVIHVDGIRLSNIGDGNFGTYGEYQLWHFEDWSEVFESYSDGYGFEEWKELNINGISDSLKLHGFVIDDSLLKCIYDSVAEEDWRSNSCGGCI